MENIVRTAIGAQLQTSWYLDMPIAIKPNTTLNEKLNINASMVPSSTDKSPVRYIAIGNGGHKMAIGANNIARPEVIQHATSHTGLYNQLPFVLRLPTDDLSPAERSKYRLRKLEIHDGITYVAYYLKVLDLTDTICQLELRTVDSSGNTTTTTFEHKASDLNPTPPNITPGTVIQTTGDYVAAAAEVPFSLNPDEVAELLNVSNVIYGSEDYAMISEIALCAATDKTVSGDFNGLQAPYVDVVGARIVSFMSVFYALKFCNTGVDLIMDVGSVEPMLKLGS